MARAHEVYEERELRRSHYLVDLAVVGALTAIYFAAGKLGLMLAFDNVSASAVWPPTGIALTAVLVLGYRVWPAVFLGAFLVNITTAGSAATSLGIATGNTLEAVLGAYLVNRFANGRHAFDRAQDVFRLAVLAGMLSTMVSATFGVTSLSLGGLSRWIDYGQVWRTWWLGDAVGVLIVAPVALLWYLHPRLRCTRKQLVEAMALLLAVIAIGLMVFGDLLPRHRGDYPVWFFCIPLLVWIAARFGQRETATATFLLSAIAIWGTLRGFGPFVRASPHESLLLLQTLMGVIAMMAMALSASMFERKRLEAHLVHLADHDPLTDVLSRRGFNAELWSQIAKAKRYGVHGSLLFLDLDDFKRVNDTLGHAAGDQVLSRVAALFRARLRDTDLLARLGGDEFAILLPHAGGAQARAVAEQLLQAIRDQPFVVEGQRVTISASIGIALFPHHGDSVDELLGEADASMYQAKAAGGNRYVIWSPELGRPSKDSELPDPEAVREALENGRMLLFGQPILDLRRNRISQYELFPYWRPEVGERFSPATVLASAERSGVIHAIDRWMVGQAIGLLARPRGRGHALQLSVNLSTKAFSDRELVPAIRRELLGTSIDPRSLVLEISETATLSDADQARTFVREVKGLGCQVALAHFGVGFFSLSQLKRLPVDYLKIDEHLIRDLEGDRIDRHLVEAIVGVSRALGPKTVGEGVGDSGTMRLLLECGIDYAQGPYVGKPAPLAEVWSGT
jgi:diguanylate cyclase (GGDEF)-like protein